MPLFCGRKAAKFAPMTRWIYAVLGWMAVTLGVIGIVVPLLPTTAFMILAAFLFAKGSPRARAWLVDHPKFGPHIRNWEEHGAISAKAKFWAVALMALVLVASILLGAPWWVCVIQALCMGSVAVFLITRPAP